jgi:hypothetical protein
VFRARVLARTLSYVFFVTSTVYVFLLVFFELLRGLRVHVYCTLLYTYSALWGNSRFSKKKMYAYSTCTCTCTTLYSTCTVHVRVVYLRTKVRKYLRRYSTKVRKYFRRYSTLSTFVATFTFVLCTKFAVA